MSIISENIKRVRTEKHMDQKDLADKLNGTEILRQ